MPAPIKENELKNLADIPGLDSLSHVGPNPETDDALDKLFAETTGAAAPKTAEEEAKLKAEADAKAKEESDAKAKAEADAKAKEEADAKTKAEADAKAAAMTDEEKAKAEAEAKAKADEAAKAAGKDELDSIELPPHTKPKTGDAFEKVKTLAREKIAALEKERTTLESKLKEAMEKGNGKLDPAIEKELTELRQFRNKLDVEADPAFQSYDEKVKGNIDSIFAKLAENNAPKESLDKIREIGVENVDWDAVKMPPALRRFIETKLASNYELADQKKAALENAKKNADEYLKSRRESFEKKSVDESKAVESEINTLAAEFAWMNPKTAKSGADEAETKAVESHNKIAGDIKEMMKEAVSDSSPRMRALLAIGTAQFVALRDEHARVKAEKDAKISELTKELSEAKELVEKIKKNSTTRLRETPATTPTEKPKNELEERGGDALDRHARAMGVIK